MWFEHDLCAELKKYNDVIIYGYEDIGLTVLKYIIEFETSIKIANYSGRVKYFACTELNQTSLRTEKKGIKIKPISELIEYADNALVIIATQEKHHSFISEVLDKFGFKNRYYIKHEDYCVIRHAVEDHLTLVNNNIQNYHLNHQIKLDRLRRKVEKGNKVKVFFMTHDSAVFGCESIYRQMENDDLFDPYLYVVSRRDVSYPKFMDDVKKDINFFTSQNYKVICGYDDYGNPKDLHLFAPDILFYDIPKLYGDSASSYNRMEQLNWQYLTCYVPYGLCIVDSFFYHFHTKCIRETWRFFVDTAANFKRVLSEGDFCAYNTVFGGYPKFDDYYKDNYTLPSKIDNNKPIVIYAPHHSLFASNNFATFDLYKDTILNFVKKHPEINFVLKPHPLLAFQINARWNEGVISFSRDDYENYIEEWNTLPNGIVITQGNYINLFKRSACMITDCGSFIGEYLPSKSPCIYMFNPRKKKQEDVYTPLAKNILNTYYIVKSESELLDYMQKIIIDKIDEKKNDRVKLLQTEFGDIGKSGEFIFNYIKNEIVN